MDTQLQDAPTGILEVGYAGEEASVERQATLLAPLTQLHSLRWSHGGPPHGLSRHDAHVCRRRRCRRCRRPSTASTGNACAACRHPLQQTSALLGTEVGNHSLQQNVS